MSRHWNPGDTRWLSKEEYLRLSPAERRLLHFQRKERKRSRPDRRPSSRSRRITRNEASIAAALSLAVAVIAYTVVPADFAFRSSSNRVAEPGVQQQAGDQRAVPATALRPEVVSDPADLAWERRGSAGSPPASAGNGGGRAIRATFSYCYVGGGVNCVVDGDTAWIGGQDVRVANIDAPETHPSRCAREAELGQAATERLHDLLNSGAVTMTSIDRDTDVYGRKLRNVAVNGKDVGETLVSAGLARPWEGHRRPWC